MEGEFERGHVRETGEVMLMIKITETLFSQNKDVKHERRSIMKRILTCLISVILSVIFLPCAVQAAEGSLANFTTESDALTFTDVTAEDWFAASVDCVSKTGLMIGVGGDRFAPEADITLAEIYTIAARIHAIYYTGSTEAADVYNKQADKRRI